MDRTKRQPSVTALRQKAAKIEEKIARLMSDRAVIEEELAIAMQCAASALHVARRGGSTLGDGTPLCVNCGQYPNSGAWRYID